MVGVSVEVRAQWPVEAFVGARGENTGAVRGVQTGAAEVSLSWSCRSVVVVDGVESCQGVEKFVNNFFFFFKLSFQEVLAEKIFRFEGKIASCNNRVVKI